MTQLWNPDLYNQALWFAAFAHQGQTIPGQKISYLLHLSQVCQEALGALADDLSLNGDLVMQCALLHDTIEDTETSYEDVRNRFGKEVADGVHALSKFKLIAGQPASKSEQMADSLRRILLQPREIHAVKLADRITNLQKPPAHWSKEKATRYCSEAAQILAALGPASDRLRQRLESKIANYQQYL